MTELGLRPRSATELVDAAFQVFRRDPVPFIVANAVFYVPWLLVRLGLALDVPTVNGKVDWSLLMISSLVGLVVYAVASAVVMALARDVYLDRHSDLASAFREVAPRIGTLTLTALITFALMIIAGTFLFFPMFYVLARFFATRPAIVIEGAGVGRSLSRSSELSSGLKWHILATLCLAGVIVLAISMGALMVTSMFSSRVIMFAVQTIVSVFVYPFFAITQTLLYYDVRIRKEGFDIEYLASGVPLDSAASG